MKKGFTLVETIVYIALFSIIMTGAFVTAYQLIVGSDRLNTKKTIQSEGNFVLAKIGWALDSVSTSSAEIISPPQTPPYTSNTLSLKKYYLGEKISVSIQYDAVNKAVLFQEGSGPLVPITTNNVSISKIEFRFMPPTGSSPAGLAATTTINGIDFAITKYIRK